jgi:PEGA domain
MRLIPCIALVLTVASCPALSAKDADHPWLIGKILDENRARYFAGMLNNSSSHSAENGDLSATANSTSYGDSTNTQINGNYSGSRTTSTSGSSVPLYRVYDSLVIEGTEAVYVTSERLRWRWSKSARVAVNGEIKYYVDGRKLHVLDEDNKEHTVEIVKEIVKPPAAPRQPHDDVRPSTTESDAGLVAQVNVEVDSTPPGADIEVDSAFVGNTPSTISIVLGTHQIAIRKKGFAPWTKTLNVTNGAIRLSAELEQYPAKQ